jgi:hypothetical protein
METNTSEPPSTCRNSRDVIKTGFALLTRDKSGRNLLTDRTMAGIEVA